mmetsp:Transcript_52319/g.150759  ORF Transcript_52319/g.150759 Transcript_52319/m.150759 type:complete len:320 (-) Transcript_52319:1083-2042(-)
MVRTRPLPQRRRPPRTAAPSCYWGQWSAPGVRPRPLGGAALHADRGRPSACQARRPSRCHAPLRLPACRPRGFPCSPLQIRLVPHNRWRLRRGAQRRRWSPRHQPLAHPGRLPPPHPMLHFRRRVRRHQALPLARPLPPPAQRLQLGTTLPPSPGLAGKAPRAKLLAQPSPRSSRRCPGKPRDAATARSAGPDGPPPSHRLHARPLLDMLLPRRAPTRSSREPAQLSQPGPPRPPRAHGTARALLALVGPLPWLQAERAPPPFQTAPGPPEKQRAASPRPIHSPPTTPCDRAEHCPQRRLPVRRSGCSPRPRAARTDAA